MVLLLQSRSFCRLDLLFGLKAIYTAALKAQFPNGIDPTNQTFKLVSNMVAGQQPLSLAICSFLNIKQIFASFNKPKGNVDTERIIRTIKENLIWPRDWTTTI